MRAQRWCTASLCFAGVFALGYTAWKVSKESREPDDLIAFSEAVRGQARQQQWRYEVMRSHDERLLVYLRRSHFIKPERAAANWAEGKLDAVIVPNDQVPRMLRDLPGSIPARIELPRKRRTIPPRYVVLKKSSPDVSEARENPARLATAEQ